MLMLALAVCLTAFASDSVLADASGAASAVAAHSAKPHRKVAEARGRESLHARSAVHSRRTTASVHRATRERTARRPLDRASSVRVSSDRAHSRPSRYSKHSRVSEQRASLPRTRRARSEETRRAIELRLERERIAREAAARREERESARAAHAESRAGLGHGASAAVASSLAMAAPIISAADAPDSRPSEFIPPPDPASLSIARGAMPPPLRGSLALLQRQDQRLEADGLERIEDEADLSARIAQHMLVPLPVSDALTVDPEMPAHHRYCRPWTARFLADLARSHEAAFHRPLEVSSAVRTVVYQARLMRINGNAAPAEGDLFSPHLMGATVDIAKKEMSRDEIAWMRRRLLTLELEGKIDVEEEFEQACFHVSVYRSYMPAHRAEPSQAGPAQRLTDETGETDGQGN